MPGSLNEEHEDELIRPTIFPGSALKRDGPQAVSSYVCVARHHPAEIGKSRVRNEENDETVRAQSVTLGALIVL
jgi:hypothetical protein